MLNLLPVPAISVRTGKRLDKKLKSKLYRHIR
nr:MAG TPA: hypothetical protein [Bacteriophage sp.]